MRTIAALVVTLTLLVPGGGAKAQTLEYMMQKCEKLEGFWRLYPPTLQDGAVIPNQGEPAICYGYILAFYGLRGSVGIAGDPANDTCYRTPEGKLAGGPNCRFTLGICIPAGVLFSQELAVFLSYARSHVAQWHEPAWGHYLSAMIAAFPCKGQFAAPAPN